MISQIEIAAVRSKAAKMNAAERKDYLWKLTQRLHRKINKAQEDGRKHGKASSLYQGIRKLRREYGRRVSDE